KIGGAATRQVMLSWVDEGTLQSSHQARHFQQALEAFRTALRSLVQLAEIDEETEWSAEQGTLQRVVEVMHRYQSGAPGLRDWCQLQAKRRSLQDRRERASVAAGEQGELEVEQLQKAFERAYVQAWVSAEY